MNILVLNAGSSSHKICLYVLGDALPDRPPIPRWEAQIDWYPQRGEAEFEIQTDRGEHLEKTVVVEQRRAVLAQVLSRLYGGETQVIAGLEMIDVVGHRVVHGGDRYAASALVTEAVKGAIAELIPLAPVHNPANLEGILLMEQLLSPLPQQVPQIAVFDTAFHQQMPPVAATYPGPYDWLEQGIRRYGFHGISHQYCARRAAQLLRRDLDALRLIVCHLGNGCSLSAVRGGHSIDTTMGFTPLEGLMMGTRSGSVDPGILIYLMRQGYDADQLDQLLNKGAGLQGISGISHDLRAIQAAMAQGNARAQLAWDLYLYRLKSCVGSMLMALGGVDALVFTAGVGEHSAAIRSGLCESLAFLGLAIDVQQNQSSPVDQDIATAQSGVRVLVIHTQEDWAIAQDCWHYLRLSQGPPRQGCYRESQSSGQSIDSDSL